MKTIADLNFGFPDAENYRRREFRDLFNQVFVKDEFLDRLCSPEISFLVGEKGTGNTAFGVWLNNNAYNNTFSVLKYIRETEYLKFVSLKREKHLCLSDYVSIWKVIVLLLLSEQVKTTEDGILNRFILLKQLDRVTSAYYANAFSPEISYALQFVQESKIAAELMAKHAGLSGEETQGLTFSETRFQINLMYIRNSFEGALRSIKLDHNHLLFIDGVDVRPDKLKYDDYLECVKGLANAVWELNNDFFPSIRDSRGRLRVVLLLRPDIFASLGLQNLNTKLRSNSVMLDWRTSYESYRSSKIFDITDRLLKRQQDKQVAIALKDGDAWDHYFPYVTPTAHRVWSDSSFIGFLRYSLYRPRDIITMLEILKENAGED